MLVNSVRNAKGDVILNFTPDRQQVLDPRVAYVMTDMMEGVMNSGTAYVVRQLGFTAPAAGKTGTSHDGWFAGYTSNLICIVWVGYDDYSDIRLSGAQTAAPIWAEFMKRAITLPQYSDVEAFSQPAGVVDVQLDKMTNRLATPSCPADLYGRVHRRNRTESDLRPDGRRRGASFRAFSGWAARRRCPPAVPPPSPARSRPPPSGGRKEKRYFWQNCRYL